MNHSLLSANRNTHLKVAAIAVLSATVMVTIMKMDLRVATKVHPSFDQTKAALVNSKLLDRGNKPRLSEISNSMYLTQ